MKKNKKVYFCGTDLQDLSLGATDIVAYPSLKKLKEYRHCLDECGIISAEITNVKWLKKQNFFKKPTKKQ